MAVEIFHDQSPRKYVARLGLECMAPEYAVWPAADGISKPDTFQWTTKSRWHSSKSTVMVLSFWTDSPGQTV